MGPPSSKRKQNKEKDRKRKKQTNEYGTILLENKRDLIKAPEHLIRVRATGFWSIFGLDICSLGCLPEHLGVMATNSSETLNSLCMSMLEYVTYIHV